MITSPRWFVTGTDTEIGKTLIASALLHALSDAGVKVAGMKPIAAGAIEQDGILQNEDAQLLAAAASVKLPGRLATPYLLRAAAAPHVAAQLDNVSITLQHVMECYVEVVACSDATVVEGIGGFKVPLSADCDTADLAVAFNLPVILVVGLRLGCLNHALLTVEAITARGLTLAGWVCNVVDVTMAHADASVDALRQRIAAPLLGVVPRFAEPTAAAAACHLDFSKLDGWPEATSFR
jgi:dethiobiotin synthetase